MLAHRELLGMRGARHLGEALTENAGFDTDTVLAVLSLDLDAARYANPYLTNLIAHGTAEQSIMAARILIAAGEPPRAALDVFRKALSTEDATVLSRALGEMELLGPAVDALAAEIVTFLETYPPTPTNGIEAVVMGPRPDAPPRAFSPALLRDLIGAGPGLDRHLERVGALLESRTYDLATVLMVLGARGHAAASFAPRVEGFLGHDDAAVRAAAAAALGRFGNRGEPVPGALRQLKNDKNAQVREAAHNAVLSLEPPRSPARANPPEESSELHRALRARVEGHTLAERLRRADRFLPEVPRAVLALRAAFGSQAGYWLRKAIDSGVLESPRSVLCALDFDIGLAEESSQLLLRLMKGGLDYRGRLWAARILVEAGCGDVEAEAVLARALEDGGVHAEQCVAQMRQLEGGVEIFAGQIVSILESKTQVELGSDYLALLVRAGPRADLYASRITALYALQVYDPVAIVSAIGSRGPAAAESLELLLDLASRQDDELQMVSAWALGEIGIRADKVIACLQLLRSATDKRVSRAAVEALARLNRQ